MSTAEPNDPPAPTFAGAGPFRVVHGLISVASIAGLAALGWYCLATLGPSGAALLDRHGPCVIGVPLAVGVATALVGGVRALDGELQFELLGLKAAGAGATLIGWVTTFSTVALAVRALW